MKIDVLSKHVLAKAGTTQLRCAQPAEYLRSLGHQVKTNTIYRALPRKVSTAFLHRCTSDTFSRNFVDILRYSGTLLIYDTDDLLFEESSFEYLEGLGRRKRDAAKSYRSMMQMCDVVTVSTPFLQEKASLIHDNVFLLRNALSDRYLDVSSLVFREKSNRHNSSVTLAYLSGSKTHDRDFAIVAPALERLMTENEHINFMLVGPLNGADAFTKFGERFIRREFVEYDRFPNLFHEIDINLVPLDAHLDFCQAKSELKFIEAGACGVPTVATATTTHKDVMVHGKNGLLVDADEDWYSTLKRAVENPEDLRTMGHQARQLVLEQYSSPARARDYADLIDRVSKIRCTDRISSRFDIWTKTAAVFWGAATRNARAFSATNTR